jgi:putative flippase GtrA
LQKIKELLQKPGVRYLLVGGSVFLLELLVIVIAEKAGAQPLIAVALSFWIGLLVSFGLQKLFTFRDRRMQHTIVASQFILYSLLVLFNFGFTLLCVKLLEGTLPTGVVRAIALGITVIWNFYLYKTRLFKQPVEIAA